MGLIAHRQGHLEVPDDPTIPFIEGDGSGPDIWRASVTVLDEAVRKACGDKRRIRWLQVLAGEKAHERTGSWLPDETVAAIDRHLVAIKGPLTTPVGGIGIAPGANINYGTGHAVFGATHGTAPKYANADVVNPSSVILSGMMVLEYLGWNEAAGLIDKGMEGAIGSRRVTYDFARLMDDAEQVSTTEFAECIVGHMG